jgi:aminopeptidase N
VATTGSEVVITERRLANDAQVASINIAQSEQEIASRSAVISWRAPVRIQSAQGGPAGDRLVSRTSPQAAALGSVVNAGQGGYFRVSYDSTAFAPLAEQFGRLSVIDQFGLLKDSLALGMGGETPISDYLRLSTALPADADAIIWLEQARTLAGIDGYYSAGQARAAFRAWVSALLAPQLKRVGFDARAGEPPPEAVLRETLLLALSQIGDPKVNDEARRRFEAARGDLSTLGPDEHRWVLVGAARSADRRTFDAIRGLARAARNPLERNELYIDLATVEDDALAGEVLTLALTDEAPTNFAPLLVREVADVHPELAWRFTLANLPAITHSLDALGRSTFVPRIAGASNDPKLATELSAYAAKNIPPDAQGEVQTALSTIRNNADIQARRLPQMNAWIASRTASDPSPARR